MHKISSVHSAQKTYKWFSKIHTLNYLIHNTYYLLASTQSRLLILEISPGNSHRYELLEPAEWLSIQTELASSALPPYYHCVHEKKKTQLGHNCSIGFFKSQLNT